MSLHVMEPGIDAILRRRPGGGGEGGCLLVALSGIDGAGKSTVAAQVAERLRAAGLGTVLISSDPWRSHREFRFDGRDPAERFYLHGYRFQELFDRLVLPLRRNGRVRLAADLTRHPEGLHDRRVYDFRQADVIVLEGSYLLRRELRPHYDLAYWLECPFDTALHRLVSRDRRLRSEREILWDYGTLHFPAQRIHLERDKPRESADLVLENGTGGDQLVRTAAPDPAPARLLAFPSPPSRSGSAAEPSGGR